MIKTRSPFQSAAVIGVLLVVSANIRLAVAQTVIDQKQLQEILKREPPEKIPTEKIADISDLPEVVAKAIVWDNYWFGYWPNKVPKMAQSTTHLTVWPVRVPNEDAVYVFIDELHSVVHCYLDHAYYVQWIDDYEDPVLSAGPRLEEFEIDKHRYGVGQQSLSVVLGPETLSTIRFDRFGALKIAKVEQSFNNHILNKDFFDEVKQYRSQEFAQKPIRIKVGNFNFDSPWIYYHVEGMEYLESIQFDSAGKSFVHLDSYSFTDPPHAWDYPHAIKRIAENGSWFVIKNGKLVKE